MVNLKLLFWKVGVKGGGSRSSAQFRPHGSFNCRRSCSAMADDPMAGSHVDAPGGSPMSLLVPRQRSLGLSTLVVGTHVSTSDSRSSSGGTRTGSTVDRSRNLGQLVRSAVAPESRESADLSEEKEVKPQRSPRNKETTVVEGTKADEVSAEVTVVEEHTKEGTEDVEVSDAWMRNGLDEIDEGGGAATPELPSQWDFEDLTLEEQDEKESKVLNVVAEKKTPPRSPLRTLVSRKWNEFSSNIPPLSGLATMSPLATLLRGSGAKPERGRSGANNKPPRGRRKQLKSALRWDRKRKLVGIEKDFYSDTSKAPKDSRRLTIQKLLANKEVKLNVEKIKWVATAFKEAGYKSGSSYLAEAKLMRVEGGGDWTPQLDRIFKMCKRALDRDRGPKKKAPEVPLERRKEANYRNKATNTMVLFPRELFQFGIAWMLREVEIAAFHASDVEVDLVRKRLTLCWRSSKCDQEGGEVRRTLQCLCSGASCAWECPFFSTMDLLDKVVRVNGSETKLALTPEFETPKKSQIVSAWCKVFKMKVTGHSARRTGALHYIREGWDIPQVGYLGRWKSAMILEYAKEALETMPANRHVAPSSWVASSDSKDVSELLAENEKAVKKQVENFRRDVATVKAELTLKMKELEKDCSEGGGNLPKLVQSLTGKVTHYNVALVASSPPITWRTRCGWFFGRSNFCFVQGVGTVNCLKCKAAQSIEVDEVQL